LSGFKFCDYLSEQNLPRRSRKLSGPRMSENTISSSCIQKIANNMGYTILCSLCFFKINFCRFDGVFQHVCPVFFVTFRLIEV